MDDEQRWALAALRFNWAPTPDDVWQPPAFHVEGLHRAAVRLVLDGVQEARRSDRSSPIGVAIIGSRGTGKTHLLGSVREQVQQSGGYFFLISLLDASAFWRSTVLSMIDGFSRETAGKDTQLRMFLRNLVDELGAPRAVRRAVTGDTALTRPSLDAFIDLLRKRDRQLGMECQDTARGLALLASDGADAQDIGNDFLGANDEVEPNDRAAWGIRRTRRTAQEVVRDISRLLALTGPTVIAVDQIDLLIAQAAKTAEAEPGDPAAHWRESLLLEQVAHGLMALRENTRRTLSVVSCLPTTWELIKAQATDTVQDRFRVDIRLKEIPSEEIGRELVARRFSARFDEAEFTPPHATWPVHPSAFAEVTDFTPRELLRTIDAHVRACLDTDEVRELTSLSRTGPQPEAHPVAVEPEPAADLDELDRRYADLQREADPAPALDKVTEDAEVPALLEAGLTAWIAEQGTRSEAYGLDPLPGAKPPLHARLRRSLAEDHEDERHWAYRAVSSRVHHIAAINRIRNASTAAGLAKGVPKRQLFLLRTGPWSSGTKTTEVVAAFTNAGGRTVGFPQSDIVQLHALRALISERGREALLPWFRSRRPTRSITFLTATLDDEPEGVPPADRSVVPAAGAVPLGQAMGDGAAVRVELEALRRHTAIFAGSGSGKTVLIRRLIEECALQGVSTIVLDPNNDLARLGDAWPEPPAGWDNAERARAAEYLRTTEVVVWTPRRQSGRPISFQPLPDFGEILDDADAFQAGVDAAVAALAPRAKADGNTVKARLGQAVLREALTSYARTGASDLRGFIGLLSALPDGASQLEDGQKIAWDMAQLLTATMVNDPLFGGSGTPVDAGLLLTPGPGFRARVSVVSFVGLPDEEQRQSFVNQLQLALFAWIKRNPAGDRPLGGLLVMDEAQTLAPSGPMTACTQSTLALASQARKYGLGLVFATQAPKGLHNRIPGNAATQFFGLLNSPAQIAAAQEMARAKGSSIPDVGRLGRGEFYVTVEGGAFLRIQAPLCLTHHPASPLTAEEVIDRARR
jgi:hypothetical protein